MFDQPMVDQPMVDQTITENPYSFSTPVENGRLFVGRDALFKWLRTHLNQSETSPVLYGPERIGKTSISVSHANGSSWLSLGNSP